VVKQTQSTAKAGQPNPAFELKPFQGVVVKQIGSEAPVLFAEVDTRALIGRHCNVPLSLKERLSPGCAAVMPWLVVEPMLRRELPRCSAEPAASALETSR
jgi:hypothetical protein